MRNLNLTPTAKLSEQDWQKLRQSFVSRGMVGGSDAGTLLGWNKWKSPISLYYQSVGVGALPTMMNMEMAMGKLQEDNIAECWQYWDGTEEGFVKNVIAKNRVRRFKKIKAIIENPKYPVLFANVDGVITKHPVRKRKQGILEIKKINGMTADSYVGGIPPQYIAQVQHYMLVCEFDYAELCMRVDGRSLIVETIDADWELQSTILKEAQQFNDRVMSALDDIKSKGTGDKDEILDIASKYEPDADSSEDFNAFISQKHKDRENENEMQSTPELADWALQYTRYNAMLKKVEEHKLLYGNRIKQVMEKNNASIMHLPDGKITWRKQFQVRFNKP